MNNLFLILLLFLTMCQPIQNDDAANQQTSSQIDEGLYLHLHRVDNQAKVYVNDSLIYTSVITAGDPVVDVKVNLDKYITQKNNTIKVDLINGLVEGKIGHDSHWQIYYELFKDGEPIDFALEESRSGEPGLMFSMTHEINMDSN